MRQKRTAQQSLFDPEPVHHPIATPLRRSPPGSTPTRNCLTRSLPISVPRPVAVLVSTARRCCAARSSSTCARRLGGAWSSLFTHHILPLTPAHHPDTLLQGSLSSPCIFRRDMRDLLHHAATA